MGHCDYVSLSLVFPLLSVLYFCWIVSMISYIKVLEGRSYRLQQPWVGIVNRSQADINKNVDMVIARRKEREYFATSPDYGHLASKMGSEYLAKLLSKVCVLILYVFQYYYGQSLAPFFISVLFSALGVCN